MKPQDMVFDLVLPDETATVRLASEVAALLSPDDLVTLSGDLGAGKTSFARAAIRALAMDETLEVPSPTYTLMQIYDLPRFSLVHADLYRINTPEELAQLGWEEAQDGAIVLVEWPDRAKNLTLIPDRLDVSLMLGHDLGPSFRRVRLTGHGKWAKRLSRFMYLRAFLITSGWDGARRTLMQGDASGRRYERLVQADRRAILMDSPARPDGPPIRNGKSYSKIAHLAEDVRPFIAMTKALRDQGYSAPQIYGQDLAHGFVLLEDLGQEGVLSRTGGVPDSERYGVAVDVLADLHTRRIAADIVIGPKETYTLPEYDLSALLIEAELLLDWYIPCITGQKPSEEDHQAYVLLWRTALQQLDPQARTWVLRDYHSPNLLWLPQREGLARIGLLDYQDAVMGHPAYDLVSLLQDARVTVSEDLELTLLGRYARHRAAAGNFSLSEFARSYAILGAQRASKILGIFARLKQRDSRPHYLQHLPRVWGYLQRCLAHPALAETRIWYEQHVPKPSLTESKDAHAA